MLARLIAAVTAGEVSEYAAGLRRRLVLYLLAGTAALCGAGFLIGAGYILAARRVGSLHASLWFGIGFLVLAGIIVIAARIAVSIRARRASRRRASDARLLAGTAALALLPSLLSRGPLGLLAPALAVLGYAIYRENSRPHDEDRSGPRDGSGRDPY